MNSSENTPTPVPPDAPAAPAAPPASAAAPGNPARRKALIAISGVVVLAAILYGIYYMLVLSHYESTDNAYVQGNIVELTPQVGGTVVAINADDTDAVTAGQLLVKLDPADAKVALAQAEAQLAQAVREVRTTYVNNGALKAQIAAREADVAKAQSEVARAQDDVKRREPLLGSGAVGKEEFEHVKAQLQAARSAEAAAQSAVVAAREQLASNQSLTEGIPVQKSPNVLRAAARVREAYLALGRTELRAPVDGFVAKRTVQLGQRVQAGTPLMSVIELRRVWVDANFKESQLRDVRIGQPVTLRADLYGKRVEYHGTVEGLGAGTGAAFALLPAQNATGNWIKVVQRLPVRIRLEPKQLQAHPLRVGLSMDVTVDIANTEGRVLAEASRPTTPVQTDVFDRVDQAAASEVQKIIEANLGAATRGAMRGAEPASDALARRDKSSASGGQRTHDAKRAVPLLARSR